jgi:hypothetical protein
LRIAEAGEDEQLRRLRAVCPRVARQVVGEVGLLPRSGAQVPNAPVGPCCASWEDGGGRRTRGARYRSGKEETMTAKKTKRAAEKAAATGKPRPKKKTSRGK